MDKKSFDIVLDEIRKCVLTDQRIKAIELVHGYFSSEQVTEMLKYFSYAEPQIKAVKAMQHKMVAITTTKVVNILNCFTFSKDKLTVLELIALNISDAQNYRPIEDLFRIHLSEKKRCRRILEQVCKVGCKAPVAMISSCGMIPGNPYPKGKPSQVNGTFPGMPIKKEGEDTSSEGKGIAARILGPAKPSPSSYNPHRPVPYPIPPCRPHATIAPSRYNNAGLMSVGGVITTAVPPPPYSATPNAAAFSRPASQQNHTPGVGGTPSPSPHGSNPPTPSTSLPSNSSSGQAPPTTPIAPVFPGMVPSQNAAAGSPLPSPASSVIKGPSLAVTSTNINPSPAPTPTPSGLSTPVHQSFPGVPPSGTPTPSVIKSHTPSVTPCGTPGPAGTYSTSPFSGMSRSGTPSGNLTPTPTPTPRGAIELSPSPVGLQAAPPFKSYPSTEAQSSSPFPGLPALGANAAQSVIRSFTPSATPSQTPTPDRSTPGLPVYPGIPPGSAAPSPKPTSIVTQASVMNPGTFYGEQHLGAVVRHGSSGSSGSNSPVPSAFKGPSRSGTPSLSSLVMPGSCGPMRSLSLTQSAGSPQTSLPSPVAMAGLQGLSATLASQAGASPAPHSLPTAAFSSLGPFPALTTCSSPFPGTPPSSAPSSASSASPVVSTAPSSSYMGLARSAAPSPVPFGLGLTTAPSIFPGPSSSFPGFAGSGPPTAAASSPVLSPFMGLPVPTSSVASVAPLQAAAVAGVPSTAPVLPRFASAFSSNFNPALVAGAGLTGGLQTPGGAAFPGILSFPAVPGFSPNTSPAALSGLHNPAVQSALLQAHSASALDSFPAQANGFTNYSPAPGTPFALQPGLHPQLGWQ